MWGTVEGARGGEDLSKALNLSWNRMMRRKQPWKILEEWIFDRKKQKHEVSKIGMSLAFVVDWKRQKEERLERVAGERWAWPDQIGYDKELTFYSKCKEILWSHFYTISASLQLWPMRKRWWTLTPSREPEGILAHMLLTPQVPKSSGVYVAPPLA